jgi:thiol-disulfide isomerase/thioredoxin
VAVNLWFASASEGVAPTTQRLQAVIIAVVLAYGLAVGGVAFGRRLRTNPLGAVGTASYLMVGAVLVLGFAWSLRSAVATQVAAPCRALRPESREGAAIDFAAQDLQGNPVRLSDFAGKFVVLNFWATWCEPCITEWPQVARLAERLAEGDERDVVVIALSIDEERPKIEPFLQQMSLAETNVVVLWDPNQSTHTQYGTEKIPDTYFIDEQGQLVDVFINVREWGSPEALRCVASVAGR